MSTQRLHPAIPSLLLLAGCATLSSPETANDRVNAETPLWFHRPIGAMTVEFDRTITADSRKIGEAWERGRPEIDAARRRVFVGSSDHGLYAQDRG